MGHEVRMVPPGWQHPIEIVRGMPEFRPLHGRSFAASLAAWDEGKARWDAGEKRAYDPAGWEPRDDGTAVDPSMTFEKWEGLRPREEDYMPAFPEGTATWLMMYETCTEGTPISPAFATPEELARWLTDHGASAFGGQRASYAGWLRVCKGGWAPSAVVFDDGRGIVSGVDGMLKLSKG